MAYQHTVEEFYITRLVQFETLLFKITSINMEEGTEFELIMGQILKEILRKALVKVPKLIKK